MANLEKFHDFYDSNSDDVYIQQQQQTNKQTKKAGPRRLALAQPQKKKTRQSK